MNKVLEQFKILLGLALPLRAVAALLGAVVISWLVVKCTISGKVKIGHHFHDSQKVEIEALKDFDWETTEALKLRPFKPTYNITLAIQRHTLSQLITIDKNYLSRVNLRRELLKQHGTTLHGCLPTGIPAVIELYEFLLREYLPVRYPTMFKLSPDSEIFHNLVTKRDYKTSAPPGDGHAALRALGEIVEEDMFLLRAGNDSAGGGGLAHFADALVCCFPHGFDPSEKLGKSLRDIHGPVPSYDKIGASMERFFGRLEVGKTVKRMNWNLQVEKDPLKFKHGYRTDNRADVADSSTTDGTIDIEHAYLRVELQTLTRLPKSRFVLFIFKTYLYSVSEIKEEGLGPALADAIVGMGMGNAPGMVEYKGVRKWKDSVCRYLRS